MICKANTDRRQVEPIAVSRNDRYTKDFFLAQRFVLTPLAASLLALWRPVRQVSNLREPPKHANAEVLCPFESPYQKFFAPLNKPN